MEGERPEGEGVGKGLGGSDDGVRGRQRIFHFVGCRGGASGDKALLVRLYEYSLYSSSGHGTTS